mgnify:CR=1 FL=1
MLKLKKSYYILKGEYIFNMIKGQKSKTNNIENLLCPFTDLYITQGANEGTHRGTMGVDVRGIQRGVRYPYYAPCTVRCIRTYPENGQVMWQSTSNVRCANGYIGIVTFVTAHDDSMDAREGMIVPQGNQLGNMGTKGNATGVHCHIEFATTSNKTWSKNRYGIYMLNSEKDLDEVCFFDNTNILNMTEYLKPKYTSSISTKTQQYVNLPPTITNWAVYDIGVAPIKKNAKAYLKPQKFGGLTYLVYNSHDYGTTKEIQTSNYGRVKIYVANTVATITNTPTYNTGNY